jgi:hypothetical protein
MTRNDQAAGLPPALATRLEAAVRAHEAAYRGLKSATSALHRAGGAWEQYVVARAARQQAEAAALRWRRGGFGPGPSGGRAIQPHEGRGR